MTWLSRCFGSGSFIVGNTRNMTSANCNLTGRAKVSRGDIVFSEHLPMLSL
jgi:hypothetical protein